MEPFKFGHAESSQWQEAALACINQLGTTQADNLGFLYTSDLLSSHLPEILDYFKLHTGISHWVGTVGLGICSVAQEYFDTPAMTVMTGYFPEDSFRLFNSTILQEELDAYRIWAKDKSPLFAIVHGDPRNGRIRDLISQINEYLGESFLVGALTSSRNLYWQIAGGITEGGLSGVLFSNTVSITTRLTQGYAIIGARHQITECYQNIIMKLDHRPALEVLKEDVGKEIYKTLEKVAGYLFIALPIQGYDTGNYLIRNLISVDPEHKLLIVGESVSPGMSVTFARRDVLTAHKELTKMLNNLKNRITLPPKGGIYYSCIGRGEHLFGKDSQELKTIQSILGDFPLVGFFAYGEISHQHLYGYTGVLTLFL